MEEKEGGEENCKRHGGGNWNRKVRVNYVHCRTGKGNLQSWRHVLDSDISDQCRKCGRYAETGKHVALVCIHGGDIGRRTTRRGR